MTPQYDDNEINKFVKMLDHCQYLQRLVKPLNTSFGINHCGVYLIFETGETLYLASKQEFHRDMLQYRLESKQRLSIIDYLAILPKIGFYMLDADPTIRDHRPQAIAKITASYDMRHDFYCLNKIESARGRALKLITFTAPDDNTEINRFFLNNLNLTKKICDYIYLGLGNVINELELITPTIAETKSVSRYLCQLNSNDGKHIQQFLNETKINMPQYHQTNIALSTRENDILYWYVRGKSTSQTAEILQIRECTVRGYFERLKQKLGCSYKHQILLKLFELGIKLPEN